MPLFTRENAAILGHRGAIARWSKPPEPPPKPPLPEIMAEHVNDFAIRRLNRVREQLDKLDAMMGKETDPKRLKEYADASARLSAQEFDLSGRPKSGSRRPKDERTRNVSAGWIELQPALPGSIAPAGQVPIAPATPSAPARPLGWEYDDPTPPIATVPDKLPGDVTP